MEERIQNNYTSPTRRIAGNTLMLYFRQILTLLVSLYTVRVVLATLGAEDYGIYNVVAGVVTMFSFLGGAMASAFQRYLTFDLANNDIEKLKITFSLGLGVFIVLGLILLLLFESVGIWFVLNKLVIPQERIFAAVCVYQAAVSSFVVILFLAPFQAILLAMENMRMYAYTSIAEVLLKLLIVLVLRLISEDRLAVYGFLLLLVPISNVIMYMGYCYRKYPQTRVLPRWSWKKQKELVSYTGWNLIGATVPAIRNQGLNIMINMFYPPVVNAARGIAFQVGNALMNFSSNFSMAMRPQIIKEYARNEKERAFSLVYKGCRYCFFLVWFFSLPLLVSLEQVLGFWLGQIPNYGVIFTRLVVLDILVESIVYPLIALMHAQGRLKEYQVTVGVIQFCNLPVSYLLLKEGYEVYLTMVVAIVLSIVGVIARVIVLEKLTGFSCKVFFTKTVCRIVGVVLLSVPVGIGIYYLLLWDGFVWLMIRSGIIVLCITVVIILVGLEQCERRKAINKIVELAKKKN